MKCIYIYIYIWATPIFTELYRVIPIPFSARRALVPFPTLQLNYIFTLNRLFKMFISPDIFE